MIKSIEIKGFRGIRDGKLEELTSLVVLVGPNGSGKSTVLDAILLGTHPRPGEALALIQDQRKRLDRGSRWITYRGEKGKRGFIVTRTDLSDATRYLRFDSKSNQTAGARKGGFGGGGLSLSDEQSYQVLFSIVNPGSPDSSGTQVGSVGDSGSSTGPGEAIPLEGVSDVVFVEPERMEFQPYLSDLFTRALESGRRDEARGILSEVLPDVTNVELGSHNGVPILYAVHRDYGLPIALEGEGVQTLARIALELAARKDGLVLIEEPEVHLHPAAIRKVARAIWAAIRRDVQVILTTHSLEFIDALASESENPDNLAKLSLYRLQLRDGCLRSARLSGEQVAFSRAEIEDDLR